jgi:hypothetical protein
VTLSSHGEVGQASGIKARVQKTNLKPAGCEGWWTCLATKVQHRSNQDAGNDDSCQRRNALTTSLGWRRRRNDFNRRFGHMLLRRFFIGYIARAFLLTEPSSTTSVSRNGANLACSSA